jgi:LCP family protein required for cell wall assembly
LGRLLVGSVLVILATAGATAFAAFHEVDFVRHELQRSPDIRAPVAPARPGAAQTILLLGSDRRPKGTPDGSAGGGARSDTIILLRLDPRSNATTMLSVPRDLKVDIPGHGPDKINDAYDLGGPALTLRTVKQLMGIPINHVVNVDFQGFKDAIDAIGCVYGDVDRRYFNDTAQYAYINLQPGYQRLCGEKGLEYARFRHEDTDLVRGVRQQHLLLDVKQQVGIAGLLGDRRALTKIVGRYTTSDSALKDRAGLLRVFKLAAFSAGQPIRQLTFQGHVRTTTGNAQAGTPSYVIASPAAIASVRSEFLRPAPAASVHEGRRPRRHPHRRAAAVGLEAAPGPGKDQALQTISQGAGGQLPVYYPTVRRRGSMFAGPPHYYKIRTPSGSHEKSYRMSVKLGTIGEYYGIQGTAWKHPPVLAGESAAARIGRRTFEIRYDGGHVATVAWRTRRGVYWVVNTLTQSLSEGQMLAIARSTRLP